MKIRTLGCLIGLSAIAASFLSCTQAKVVCSVGHAASTGYAVLYTPKGSMPDCASTTTHESGVKLNQLKGDLIGFETYHPANKTKDGVTPDFSTTTVAWQSDSLGVLRLDREAKDAPAEEGGKAYAFGTFVSTEPDDDNFCLVKDVQPAEISFPGVTETKDETGMTVDRAAEDPINDIKYEWSNLKIYVTAAAPGTQFSGDLKYTQNGCTVEYHATALWPAVDCGDYETDDLGNNVALKGLNSDACLPEADPASGRVTGSGINPDFPVVCTAIRDKAIKLPSPTPLQDAADTAKNMMDGVDPPTVDSSTVIPALAVCALKGEPPSFNTKR